MRTIQEHSLRNIGWAALIGKPIAFSWEELRDHINSELTIGTLIGVDVDRTGTQLTLTFNHTELIVEENPFKLWHILVAE